MANHGFMHDGFYQNEMHDSRNSSGGVGRFCRANPDRNPLIRGGQRVLPQMVGFHANPDPTHSSSFHPSDNRNTIPPPAMACGSMLPPEQVHSSSSFAPATAQRRMKARSMMMMFERYPQCDRAGRAFGGPQSSQVTSQYGPYYRGFPQPPYHHYRQTEDHFMLPEQEFFSNSYCSPQEIAYISKRKRQDNVRDMMATQEAEIRAAKEAYNQVVGSSTPYITEDKNKRNYSYNKSIPANPKRPKYGSPRPGHATDPSDKDVLLGRGTTIDKHPGNRYFRKLLADHRKEYMSASKKIRKFLIATSVVEHIHKMHGRFLQQDNETGFWFPVDDGVAREKASRGLRRDSRRSDLNNDSSSSIPQEQGEGEEDGSTTSSEAPPRKNHRRNAIKF